MADTPVIGLEYAWHRLMVLLGGTLNNRASAARLTIRVIRSQQVRR